jgi:uncharacterized protein
VSTSKKPRAAVLGVVVGALATSGLAVAAPASAAPADARITEIHYDNAGTDTGEAIEVTAPTAADLERLTVVLYNGANGLAYGTPARVRPAAGQTAATVNYGTDGVQNGAPDGVALVDPDGAVIEFLSYEGTLTAADGPAQGMTSTDIGVSETGTTLVGHSLQRDLATGTWSGPAASTFAPGPPPLCQGVRTVPIGEVQGDGPTTLCSGATVTIAGTVVGDLQEGGFGGFFVQDGGDGDAATSDGIFVYDPDGAPAVSLGDQVTVRGRVSEFSGVTQLGSASVTVGEAGGLPAATTLPLPSTDAQREALEGMLVALEEDPTVSEVYNLNRFGEIMLAEGGRLINPTETAEPGAPAKAAAAANAARSLLLDDGRSYNLANAGEAPPHLTLDDPVRVGDTAVLEPTVLSYGFNAWRLQPADGTPEGTTFPATNPRPAAPAEVGGDLRIADFNVLNYFVDFPSEFGDDARGATNAEELAEQQAKIVTAITALEADIITLHEIENSAELTPATPYRALETLVAALNEAEAAVDGIDTWRFVRAHEASDVITNAIIYRVNAAQPIGAPSKPAEDAVWDNAREPIAQTFRSRGEVFTVIANHLKSKGSGSGINADQGDGQGASNADRVAQAQSLVAFAGQVAAKARDTDVLLTGDFNAYRTEDPLDVVRNAGFVEVFNPGEYSYVFEGTSGSLDHVFASPSMLPKISGHTVWDINSVESYAYQYDGFEALYAPYAYRASDHNPTLVGVDTKTGTPAVGTGG